MTENEAIYCLKAESERHSEVCEECSLYGKTGCDHCYNDATDMAIKALEEVQEFRKLGTVEDVPRLLVELNVIHQYTNIGTVRECKIAVERMKGGAT